MKKIFILLSTVFLLNQVYAQTDTRGTTVINTSETETTINGNTYALIIGINYANRKKFSQLHYAVNDANLLKSFFQSGIFFDSIPDDNIKIILDKDATAAQLWYGFDWLTKKAKKGDRAIIYFAGHGIASGPSLGFLIAYDAPDVTDPSQFGFQGGSIPIYQLKITIEQLKNNGVSSYLITDACRTNEQKDSSQINFQNILESNEGEIQFSSCSRSQSSMEDAKWGGGHGLFSYYLIKGLCGYADEESEYTKDGKVTLEELKEYVEKHVRNDSRNLITNKPQQIPYININNADNQEQPIAFVKPDKPINQQFKEDNLIAAVNRGMNEDTSALYKSFTTALENKKFFEGEPGNAYSLLMQIKSSRTEEKYQDAAQEYVIHLLNDAQLRINKYFEGVDTNYTSSYFDIGAKELNIALSFMPKEHPLYKVYTINRLFLEARSIKENYSKYDLANAKIDSALALDSTIAYLYYTKGLLEMNRLKWKKALPYFEKAHSLKQDWIFPTLNIASCYLSLNKLSEAKELYYENLKKDSLNATIWNELGLIFYNNSQYDSAMICYKKAIAADSNYLYSIRNLGDTYSIFNDQQKAKQMYWRAIKTDSTNAINWSYIGYYYSTQRRYDSAIIFYKKAVTLDSDYLYALINLANVYVALHQNEKAKQIFWHTIIKDSTDANNCNYLGNFYYSLKQYDSAIIIYKKAIAINPIFLYGLRNMGDSYRALHQNEKAKEMYWRAINADSLDANNWNSLGVFFFEKKQYDSAITFFLKALSINPKLLYSLRNLGQSYAALHKFEKASEMYWRAIKADSLLSDNWNELGVFYYNRTKYDSAAIFFEKAIAVNPGYLLGVRNLANTYDALRQTEKAKQLYAQAVETDSLNTDSWNSFGNFYYRLKRYDTAAAYFKKGISIDSNLLALKNLADIYVSMHETEKAKKLYWSIIKIDSLNVDAWHSFGNFYYTSKQWDSALYFYKRAVSIDSNYLDLKYLGDTYAAIHQNNNARQMYWQAINGDSANADYWNALGNFYSNQKKYDSAIIYFTKAKSLNPDNNSADAFLGVIYFYQNNFDSSKWYFSQTIKLNPYDTRGYSLMGLLFSTLKSYDSATLYYRKAIALDPDFISAYNNIASDFNTRLLYDSSKFYYLKVLQIDSLNTDAYYSIANLFYQQNLYDSAKKYDIKALKTNAKYAQAYYSLGNIFKHQNLFDSAKEYYLKAINVDTTYQNPYNEIGNIFYDQNLYDSALVYYFKAIRIDSNFREPYYNIANFFYNKTLYDSAKAYYEKSIKADAKFAQAYYSLGNIFKHQNLFDSAKEYYLKAINVDTTYQNPYNEIGNIFYDQGLDDSALVYYLKAIHINLKFKEPYYNIGNLFYNNGGYDSAKFYYTKVIKIDTAYANAYTGIANAYYYTTQPDSAKIYYEKAITIDPNSKRAYRGLSDIFYGKGLYDSARRYAYKAISIDPNYPDAYLSLGNTFYDTKLYDSAKVSYRKAIALFPKYLAAYNNLGDVFYIQKIYDSAKPVYQNVLLFDSLNTHANNYLSLIAFNTAKIDSSIMYLSKLFNTKRANYITYRIGLAVAGFYQNLKLFDKEISFAQYLYNYDSVNSILYIDSSERKELLDILGFAYLNTNQLAKSTYYYTKEGTIYYYYYNLACLASLAKKNDEAIKNLELSFKDGYNDYDHLQKDPDLDNIRNTDKYKQLLKKYFPDK